MSNQLDDFLLAPLPAVADDGFTAKVMARIEAERFRETMSNAAIIGLCALLAMPFLPVREMLAAFVPEVSQLTQMPALYIAAAVVALSLLLDRETVGL